jgi:hypothetical protein
MTEHHSNSDNFPKRYCQPEPVRELNVVYPIHLVQTAGLRRAQFGRGNSAASSAGAAAAAATNSHFFPITLHLIDDRPTDRPTDRPIDYHAAACLPSLNALCLPVR